MTTKKPKLTIAAISFNEEEHIQFWYEHHKELADEFILVDTDSTDRTVEIIKDFPAVKLVQIKWHHSFAGAKNVALRHCTGDWILFLSPDFWIDEENFAKIRKAIETDNVAYVLPLVHHFKEWIDEEHEKQKEIENILVDGHLVLFKNDPFIYYENRVHESVNESVKRHFGEEAIKTLPVVRHHDNTKNQINNKLKLRYYWFLEDYATFDRKFWEHGQILRKEAYDNE